MRRFWMTMALIGLLALPVLAQFRGFGGFGGGMSGDQLLTNKSVQDELKLNDTQKKAITEITKKNREAMTKAFGLFREDREEAQKLMKQAAEDQTKSLKTFKDSLTSEQTKRFHEIEVQVATTSTNPNIFKHSGVQKGLKLTSKQQETVKEALSDLEKDTKEVFEDAKGNKEKFKEAGQKIRSLTKETYEKITKSFTEDQAKAWKEMGGEKFELKMEKGKFGKGGKGGKKDKKKDDF